MALLARMQREVIGVETNLPFDVLLATYCLLSWLGLALFFNWDGIAAVGKVALLGPRPTWWPDGDGESVLGCLDC